ncbi:hypothetical protein C1646_775259 [Rhizophagus diaphanus]|nr:hypothetical protein C1646_775259 [Rhizophagus diaphanus] [Rhizophagus sp. MUCL 43196]
MKRSATSKEKSDRIDTSKTPPSCDILTNRLFEEKLEYVNSKVLRELEVTKNLTLNLFSNFYTSEFIAKKIENILIRVGVEKFSAIVSDNDSNV